MPKLSPIHRALAKYDDSPTKMAAALGCGVLRQHVEHWRQSGRVPTEHCRRIQELTGVKCWEFRPDDWHRIWPDLIGTQGAPKVPQVEATSPPAGRAAEPTNSHPSAHTERRVLPTIRQGR